MHETLATGCIHLAVDLLILTVRESQLQVVLSQRTQPPYQGCWALPGQLAKLDESAEECAQALLSKMLPVEQAHMEQLYTFSSVERDLRGRVISIAYLVIVPWQQLEKTLRQTKMHCFGLSPAEEPLRLTAADGLTLDESQLAFDHGQIIQTGHKRLRGKIDYTELGFRFLHQPDSFSLGDLQTIYEAVLSEKLDTSNFRRSILSRYETAGRIRQTESARKQGRGRPAALYQYIP